ncbi:hypothetical protein [uncultured Fluviicola sp.]|uniref:hypothetical protein n=1 Tax=uncultured Fluviicola sp. TaxID=463303 RepID=UPI0025EF78E1|nr:hypothetical protein [uncultured Fluviicola sp.]
MNQTSTTLVINEGKTLNYLIPLIFCALGALISLVLFWPLGILFSAIAIILGLIETGLEFNPQTMEYRKYKSLFASKWGEWKKIPDPDSFHLRLSVESHTYRTYAMGASPNYYGNGNGRSTSKSITYDIMVKTKNEQWIILYEFLSYKLALNFVKHMRELESFEITDHIALKLEENQQKRMNRMR